MNFKLLNLKQNSQDQQMDRLRACLTERYGKVQDPWGLNINSVMRGVKILSPLYRSYFKVRVFGRENIPQDDPFIAVSNHTGQIPIDGIMIILSFLLDTENPILLRSMVERFLVKLPFLGSIAAETGAILGDRKNCQYLLKHGESILVFPEGVRGIAKPTSKFYQTQKFSQGFFRLAIDNKTKILPISVVGAEQMYPWVMHVPRIAKFLKVPAFPISPFFPLFGPLGTLPLPSPIDIYINPVYEYPDNLNPQARSESLDPYVNELTDIIQKQVDLGLKDQRGIFNSDFQKEAKENFKQTVDQLKSWLRERK